MAIDRDDLAEELDRAVKLLAESFAARSIRPALIGGLATNRGGGAALVAGAGALGGGLVGGAAQQNQAAAYGPPPPGGYPRATPTERPGFVISPYAPYYEIDTRGAPRGALIRDPSCGRLFIKP